MRNVKDIIRKIKRVNVLYIGLIFMVGCGNNSSEAEGDSKEEKLLELPLVERFDFEDLEGNKINWNETKGKLVFVNFWATWCKPCIKEMPSISEANIQLKEEGVLFIVASDEDVSKIQKFESKHHYSFNLLHSNTSVFDLDVQALPTTIIINEEGKIVFNEIGSRDWSSDKSIALIKSFSAKK